MVSLVAGALLLVLLLYLAKAWARIDPKKLLALLSKAVGVAALAGALFTLLTGRFALALPLGIAGLALLGMLDPSYIGGPFGALLKGLGAGRTASKVSRVTSALFDMELNHATGELTGRVIQGEHAGSDLAALDVAALVRLRGLCDAQSLALLEAYLDRRAPAWREHAQGNAGRGGIGAAGAGAMTEEEAHQILGLEPGADEATVRAAHRALIKKLHPDQGGSSYLAARINQAKDVLLRRHA